MTSLVPALLLALAFTSASPAAVVLTTFGSGDSYNTNQGYTVGTASGFEHAVSFVLAQSIRIESFRAALWSTQGPPVLHFSVTQAEPSCGLPLCLSATQPGPVIETIVLDNLTPFQIGIVAFPSATQPVLDAGVTYYLKLSAPAGSRGAWMNSSTGQIGVEGKINGSWVYFGAASPAFELNGTVVPEPATYALAAAALTLLALRRKRP